MQESKRIRGAQVFAGALIGVFQLVGRWQADRLLAVGDAAGFLEFRVWVLVALSFWLIGVVAARGPLTKRFDAGGVGSWGNMIVFFLVYMIVTSLWAPDVTLALAKSYDLLFVVWACTLTVAALRLCGVHATIEGFWAALFGAGVVLAVVGIVGSLTGTQERLSVLGGGPNVFGRNMGLLTLASLRFVFDNRRWVRMPALVVAPLAALLVLQSGSRGAMLALFFGVVVYLAVIRVDRRVFISIVLAGMVGTLALVSRVGELAVLIFRERFLILLLAQRYFTHRDTLLLDGVTAGIRNPVGGLGLAGFAQLDSHGTYPHNMFVEAFAEGGLLGFALLCLPFLQYVRRWRNGMGLGDPVSVAGLSLLAVSSSISGDLFDARGVFLLLLMAVASQMPTGARIQARGR